MVLCAISSPSSVPAQSASQPNERMAALIHAALKGEKIRQHNFEADVEHLAAEASRLKDGDLRWVISEGVIGRNWMPNDRIIQMSKDVRRPAECFLAPIEGPLNELMEKSREDPESVAPARGFVDYAHEILWPAISDLRRRIEEVEYKLDDVIGRRRSAR